MSREILWAQYSSIELRVGDSIPLVRLGLGPAPRLAGGPLAPKAPAHMTLPAGLLPLINHQGQRVPRDQALKTLGSVSVSPAEVVLPRNHPAVVDAPSQSEDPTSIEALWFPACTELQMQEHQGALGVIPGLFFREDERVLSLGSSFPQPLYLQRLPRVLLASSQLVADNTDVTVSMGRLLEDFVQQFSSPAHALPHVRIATGYLYAQGLFRLLSLLKNERILSLQLLFSGKTDKQTARALTAKLEEKIQEGAEDATPEVWKRFSEAAQSGRLQVRVYPDAFLHAKLFIAYDERDKNHRLLHSQAVVGSSNISSSGLSERGNLELNVSLNNQDQNTLLLKWFEGRWEEGCDPDPALLEILERQAPPQAPHFVIDGLSAIYQAGIDGKLSPSEAHTALLGALYEKQTALLEVSDEPLYPVIQGTLLRPTLEQEAGVRGLVDRLLQARIAFLADSVGLGKTVTSIGAAWYLRRTDRASRIALIAPRKFLSQWQSDAQGIGAPGDLMVPLNRHLLERMEESEAVQRLAGYDLLLIEEAHESLRSRTNKLWKHLRAHLQQNRQARVLLISATPWNNRREDILNYLLLAWNDGRLLCEQYPALNAPPLRDYLGQFSVQPGGGLPASVAVRWFEQLPLDTYRQIFDATFVQRTRSSLARRYSQVIDFPERIVHPFTTQPDAIHDALFSQLKESLEKLSVPYREPFSALERARVALEKGSTPTLSNLHRSFLIQLYKRAESSTFALAVSLASVERRLDQFESTLSGLIKSPTPHQALHQWLESEYLRLGEDEDEDEDSEALAVTSAEKRRVKEVQKLMDSLDDTSSRALLQRVIDDQVEVDRQIVQGLRAQLPLAVENQAPKDILLAKLARGAFDQHHKPVLIAGYADTALRTFLRLLAQLPDAHIGLALGGDEAWISRPGLHDRSALSQTEWALALSLPPQERRDLLLRQSKRAESCERSLLLAAFAPLARHTSAYQLGLLGGEVDILVGSEAIGVGQNLQDSTCLIHLDMPWNPMVLEQRIGRVDRRGGGRPDPTRPTGPRIVDVYYCWSSAAVEQEVSLRERLKEKAEGAIEDTNFDEILLHEVRNYVEQTRQQRASAPGFSGEDQALRAVLDQHQREIAEQQGQVKGISSGAGSALDAFRLLAEWKHSHPGIPVPATPIAAGMAPHTSLPGSPGWLLTVAVTPLSAHDEPIITTPLHYHFAIPGELTDLGAPDLEIVVRQLHLGGDHRARPSGGRSRWTNALLTIDRLLQVWAGQLLKEHNEDYQQRITAQQTPVAQRNPSEKLRVLALQAKQNLGETLKVLLPTHREAITKINERIRFLVSPVLDPATIHELLMGREEALVEQDLIFIRDYARRFLLEDFDETFDNICGQRWLDKQPPAQLPLIATIDGRWHRLQLRVLAATWCAT